MKLLRTKRVLTSACIAAAAFVITPAMAQDTLVLTPIWRLNVNTVDSMSTPLLSEMLLYPSDGALFYLPGTQRNDTTALYRATSGTDHMDTPIVGEGGYATEGIMGYPFTSPLAAQALVELVRGYNGSDHMLMKKGETRAGYATPGMGLYGYQRFNNLAEGNNTITGGGVTVQSNTVAGGAIWSWQWNGVEYVDTQNFGRSIQTAMFWNNQISARLHNPVEAGDRHSNSATPAALRHGSPILYNHNVGLKQITRAIPLEFTPSNFSGGTDRPVVYKDMVIGKDLTLDYNGMGAVVQYEAVVYNEQNIAAARVEAPTGYLKTTFNTFYTYDASTQARAQVTPQNCPADYTQTGSYIDFVPSSGYGGIIISNAAQTAAMGIYGRTTGVGGKVSSFTMFDFIGNCGDTVKWAANYAGALPGGESRYKVYIVNGSLTDVTAKMRQLFSDGAL